MTLRQVVSKYKRNKNLLIKIIDTYGSQMFLGEVSILYQKTENKNPNIKHIVPYLDLNIFSVKKVKITEHITMEKRVWNKEIIIVYLS